MKNMWKKESAVTFNVIKSLKAWHFAQFLSSSSKNCKRTILMYWKKIRFNNLGYYLRKMVMGEKEPDWGYPQSLGASWGKIKAKEYANIGEA